MKVNVIFDLQQYQWVLVPVLHELSERGHRPVVSYTYEDTEFDCDCSLAIQDVAWRKTNHIRPRFFINHGVSATKSWALDMPIDYFIAQSDYWADRAEEMKKDHHRNYEVIRNTGWPKMDLLYQFKKDKEILRNNIYEGMNLDKNKPLVLCFPTYKKNRDYHESWERTVPYYEIYESIRKYYNVLVFPHIMDDTGEFNNIFDAGRVITVHDIRRLHFQAAADIIVSDASGISYEACGIDTPVILLATDNNPTPRIEGLDVGEEVNMGNWVYHNELKDTIDEVLETGNDEIWKATRKYWSDKYLGPVDGNAAKRIVDEMEKRCG